MVLRLVRRLLGVTLSFALVLVVTGQLGPQLAARSMGGYVRALDHAPSGHPETADSIASQLEREWRDLGRSVSTSVASVQRALGRALDRI